MEDRRRRRPVVTIVAVAVTVGFLALTGMSYAQWGTPLGWMGGCRTYGGYGGAVGQQGSVSLFDAERIAAGHVASHGSPDTEMVEIMEFDNHYDAEVREESTGRYAFEFVIDRVTAMLSVGRT